MLKLSATILLASVLAASQLAHAAPNPNPQVALQPRNSFQAANGRLAQQLENAKATAKNGDACTNETCCGLFVCLCLNNKLLQTVSCSANLPCQVLPLVNKAGVSATCTSDADKTSRIQIALGSGGAAAPAPVTPPAPAPAAPAPQTPPPRPQRNNAPANTGGAVSDAQRIAFLKRFSTSDFNTNAIVPLTAPEVAVPNRRRTAEQGCAEVGNGFICFDLSRNIRCVNGKVTRNQVRPFDANTNLK
ncbi:hypothetical protein BC829DRAFT_34269 [Chytridium lagenaria]|nr:hypothetical protein BC829DRAFT_34269 [Chytridium lagenaria]